MAMTRPVQDAIDRADNDCGLELTYLTRDEWQTIRAELHRLTEIAEGVVPLAIRLGEVTTELERMRGIVAACANEAGAAVSPTCSEQFLSDVPLEIRAVCRNAESRLAAANALLLDVSRYLDPRHYAEAIKRIQSHLQGAGDEAV
jgi:hypothetical protein